MKYQSITIHGAGNLFNPWFNYVRCSMYSYNHTMEKLSLKEFIEKSLPVSSEALTAIVSHFDERTIQKNDYFLKAGRISNEYLFLEEGFMRAFTQDTEGNEVTTYFFQKDRVVFEAASFFMRLPSAENIQAITDCIGYTITFDKLNMLFHTVHEFREFGRKMLVKEFAAFKDRTLSLINKSAEERYSALMKYNPELFQYAQLKHIASFLGITDTSLSRIRREYSKK
jgi:CRP-like cAMP-binding protein